MNAAGLLHNFILEERELGDNDTLDSDKTMFQNFSQTTINYLDEPQADPNLISSPTESAIAIFPIIMNHHLLADLRRQHYNPSKKVNNCEKYLSYNWI